MAQQGSRSRGAEDDQMELDEVVVQALSELTFHDILSSLLQLISTSASVVLSSISLRNLISLADLVASIESRVEEFGPCVVGAARCDGVGVIRTYRGPSVDESVAGEVSGPYCSVDEASCGDRDVCVQIFAGTDLRPCGRVCERVENSGENLDVVVTILSIQIGLSIFFRTATLIQAMICESREASAVSSKHARLRGVINYSVSIVVGCLSLTVVAFAVEGRLTDIADALVDARCLAFSGLLLVHTVGEVVRGVIVQQAVSGGLSLLGAAVEVVETHFDQVPLRVALPCVKWPAKPAGSQGAGLAGPGKPAVKVTGT